MKVVIRHGEQGEKEMGTVSGFALSFVIFVIIVGIRSSFIGAFDPHTPGGRIRAYLSNVLAFASGAALVYNGFRATSMPDWVQIGIGGLPITILAILSYPTLTLIYTQWRREKRYQKEVQKRQREQQESDAAREERIVGWRACEESKQKQIETDIAFLTQHGYLGVGASYRITEDEPYSQPSSTWKPYKEPTIHFLDSSGDLTTVQLRDFKGLVSLHNRIGKQRPNVCLIDWGEEGFVSGSPNWQLLLEQPGTLFDQRGDSLTIDPGIQVLEVFIPTILRIMGSYLSVREYSLAYRNRVAAEQISAMRRNVRSPMLAMIRELLEDESVVPFTATHEPHLIRTQTEAA